MKHCSGLASLDDRVLSDLIPHPPQKKELFQLQAHISSIFQKPDEGLIEDIFRMYDTDRSGDINEQELISGLASAGESTSLQFFAGTYIGNVLVLLAMVP